MTVLTLIKTYPTNRALIQACRQGESEAWEQLLDKYERLVFSIPLNYGLSHEDAADVVQLTFTILLQSLDSLREVDHLGSWLTTVAKRHTWRLLNQNKHVESLDRDEVVENIVLVDESEKTNRERKEIHEWILQGLSELGERCRNLLNALYFDADQPSYIDVAAQLNMQVGSIGPTRIRCLAHLQEIMVQLQ